MSKKMKRVTVGMLAFCLAIAGFFLQGVLSTKASTDTVHETCSPYVEEMEVNGYRTNGFTAPPSTKDGYVFSGWYTDEDCKTPLSSGVESGTAYARFVPSHILSVKAQISANLLNSDASDDDTAAIRFITTVDSLQYHEIGFDITIGEKTVRKSSNQVYDSLYAIGKSDGEVLKYTPQENFCSLSTYFKTWAFINVPSSAYGTEITVQPFWITLDGTTVYGESGVKTVQQGIDSYFSNTADTSWYDESKTDFTLYTPQELYGFAELVNKQSVTFADKTVRLGADIALNVGNAEDWSTTEPMNKWTPVNGFKGTFNGQGHTLSGIYVSVAAYTGLFKELPAVTTVENLKLVNSYIEGTSTGTRASVGSIAGRNYGTINTVYSEAIVKNKSSEMTGGIAGMAWGTESVITNCWFNGRIIATKSSTGGILGGTYQATTTIAHCLNTGTLSLQASLNPGRVGGLCGYIYSSSKVTLTDSLNAGSLDTGDYNVTQIGTIVGCLQNTGTTAEMNNVYGIMDFSTNLLGYNQATGGDLGTTELTKEQIKGIDAYKNTSLDFENYWVLRTREVPTLKAFDEGDLDVNWYYADSSAKEFTINTPQELYGFAELVNNQKITFADTTVKLGADITLNVGNAEDWSTIEPMNKWTPVNGFKGTFDGQGHTLSGIYATGSFVGLFHTINSGSSVENLRIVNSYFEGTSTGTRQSVGSVAGRNHGTIENVYSDAIVKNSSQMTGGIAGMVVNSKGSFINCWFDGKVISTNQSCGGILGGLYGYGTTTTKETNTATMKHCLNTGYLYIQGTSETAVIRVGGLCGSVQLGTLTLEDSLSAGTLETIGTQVGAVVGTLVNANSAVTAKNVYGVEDTFSTGLISWNNNEGPVIETSFEMKTKDEIKGIDAYKNTSLDFENYWVLRFEKAPALKAFDEGDLDVNWYYANSSAKEFTINTSQELYGMCALDNTFSGKTINLGADIVLNTGDAKDWAETAPDGVWTVRNLAGTFNGNGHTISGLYVKSSATYTGLFGTINAGARVSDLKIVNSYIEGNCTTAPGNRAGVGSIAGRNTGTIQNVYSEAIVKNSAQMTGGIAGMVSQDGENTISNCWFAGEIYANTASGGILGCTYGKAAVVEHCLNTGTLNITSGSQVGGLCGYAQGSAVLTLKDSLNAGSLIRGTSVSQIGTIVGSLHTNATINVGNAYGITEFSENDFGYTGAGTKVNQEENTEYKAITLEAITGDAALNTKLDFTNSWITRPGTIPMLKVFADMQ